ncbi:hypothetical protein D3C78_823450 [compost metagenome]
MQHAEEADAEAEAQGLGALRLVLQGGVVQGQLLQGFAEVLEVIGADREQAGVDLRLDALEARQHVHVRRVGQSQGVANRRAMDVLDAGDDEAHFAGLEVGHLGVLRGEYADAVHLVELAGGLHQDLVALLHPAVLHAHQRDHAQVVVEPGVDDQGLQRRLDLTDRRRNDLDQLFQHVDHAHAALGAAGHGVGGVDADDVLDLVLDPLRLCLGQVHLVQHRHDLQALLDGGVAVGHGLGFHALAGVDDQQRAFAGRQGAADFVGEVHMAGGVDEVQLIGLTVLRLVVQGDAVGLDGDAALTLQVHGVQYLGLHLAVGQAAAHLNEAVCQGRLAMVDVGDDGEIADMTQVTHGSTLEKAASRLARRKIAGEFT